MVTATTCGTGSTSSTTVRRCCTYLKKGPVAGETYNIGGNSERRNIDVVRLLCDIVDKRLERCGDDVSQNLITFVKDRPGHDRRYAIDAGKLRQELGWQPHYQFEDALKETVNWYLDHPDWINDVRSGEYRQWIEKNYSER